MMLAGRECFAKAENCVQPPAEHIEADQGATLTRNGFQGFEGLRRQNVSRNHGIDQNSGVFHRLLVIRRDQEWHSNRLQAMTQTQPGPGGVGQQDCEAALSSSGVTGPWRRLEFW